MSFLWIKNQTIPCKYVEYVVVYDQIKITVSEKFLEIFSKLRIDFLHLIFVFIKKDYIINLVFTKLIKVGY